MNFTFDGMNLTGRPGDTIAAALLRAQVPLGIITTPGRSVGSKAARMWTSPALFHTRAG